ncbi:cytochrome P450 [Striga asiatica]|uniref:Cytochrome P450 n=1 Tax=Striga asiatica TaxID=4170 RepID=A0A5A7RJH8_STRAF|nr:cytochrome P450 [Striga asiatica]
MIEVDPLLRPRIPSTPLVVRLFDWPQPTIALVISMSPIVRVSRARANVHERPSASQPGRHQSSRPQSPEPKQGTTWNEVDIAGLNIGSGCTKQFSHGLHCSHRRSLAVSNTRVCFTGGVPMPTITATSPRRSPNSVLGLPESWLTKADVRMASLLIRASEPDKLAKLTKGSLVLRGRVVGSVFVGRAVVVVVVVVERRRRRRNGRDATRIVMAS